MHFSKPIDADSLDNIWIFTTKSDKIPGGGQLSPSSACEQNITPPYHYNENLPATTSRFMSLCETCHHNLSSHSSSKLVVLNRYIRGATFFIRIRGQY